VEILEGCPDMNYFTNITYVPLEHGGVWGMFDVKKKALSETVDLHGPNGEVQNQSLVWKGKAKAESDADTYIYGGTLNPHYGHFLINTLSRLWPFAISRVTHPIVFHAHGSKEEWFSLPFARDIFAALDIDPSLVTIFKEPTLIHNLVVPSVSFQEQHFVYTAYRDLCRYIGRKILGHYAPRTGLPPAYLSKSTLKSGVGHVVNEQQLEDALQFGGVEIIRPENLSLRDQIMLFAERDVVLGTIGSGFHTSIFVPPHARLMILSTIPGPNSNFYLIDKVNGNRAQYFYSDKTEVTNSPDDTFLTSFTLGDPFAVAEDLLRELNLQSADCPRDAGPKKVPEENNFKQEGSMSLYSLFLNNTGRPIHKSGHYFFAYERHFGRFVGQPVTFLEIGAGNGGSSQMWKKWLGPMARIVTIDLNPVCRQFEDEQIAVRIGDQSDPNFLQSILDEFGQLDIVLDDGSHQMAHVNASFDFLFSRMAPNGIYMIEDMHTAYWADYGGGYKATTSMIERFKDMIDLLNADHIRDGSIKPNHFTKTTFSMTAYDSILVFERSPYVNKTMRMIGDDAQRVNY
jgi:capsular polysaccharide biosynthesis protein